MKAISEFGQTILFVSHNLQTVRSTCSNCMVLKNGKVSFSGPRHQAINHYVDKHTSVTEFSGVANFDNLTQRYGTGEILIEEIRIYNSESKIRGKLYYRKAFSIELECRVIEPVSHLTMFYIIMP